jgi:hypothetical protein
MRKVSRKPFKQFLPAMDEITCSKVERFKIKSRFVTNCKIGAKNIAGWIPHENSLPARPNLRTSKLILASARYFAGNSASDVNALRPQFASKAAANG